MCFKQDKNVEGIMGKQKLRKDAIKVGGMVFVRKVVKKRRPAGGVYFSSVKIDGEPVYALPGGGAALEHELPEIAAAIMANVAT